MKFPSEKRMVEEAYRRLEEAYENDMYETCVGCGKEYLYPYLCWTHHLCGLCHPVPSPLSNTSSVWTVPPSY